MLYASIIYQPLYYILLTQPRRYLPFPVTHCYSLRKIANEDLNSIRMIGVRIIEVQLSQDFQEKVGSGQLFDMGGSTVKTNNKTTCN